jgi:hypothetical protein
VIVNGLPLLALQSPLQELFVTRRRAMTPPPPARNRAQHAANLNQQIDAVAAEIVKIRETRDTLGEGAIVAATGAELDAPDVAKQFRTTSAGTELLASDEGRVVFRVTDNLAGLRTRTTKYATEDTPKGNPRFNNLIARIDDVALATIEDLSLGEIPADIPDASTIWVEIWVTAAAVISNSEQTAIEAALGAFTELSSPANGVIPVLRGEERDVFIVQTTGEALKALPVLLPQAVEVHRAPTVFPIVMAEATEAGGDLSEVSLPLDEAVAVAIHDSGVDASHPYISPILLGAGSVVPGEPAASDSTGHGTQMAGVAAYPDLATDIAGGLLHADSWLISMRLLDSAHSPGGDPERGVMWPERTAASIQSAEQIAGSRPVIHNLSIGADNPTLGRSDRTAWSVST